eukprot:scaffold60751_cov36-Cyclotella_meneghiniana.AAC.5
MDSRASPVMVPRSRFWLLVRALGASRGRWSAAPRFISSGGASPSSSIQFACDWVLTLGAVASSCDCSCDDESLVSTLGVVLGLRTLG